VLESPPLLHHHSNQDRIRREQVALEKKTLSQLAFWCQLLFFEQRNNGKFNILEANSSFISNKGRDSISSKKNSSCSF